MSNKVKNINGIDTEGLQSTRKDLKENANNSMVDYNVKLNWLGGTKSEVKTEQIKIGNQEFSRGFSFIVDEPEQLLGENKYPTPQEYLLGGMGACMIVGYTVGAAVKGIKLEQLEIEIEAGLDLRGFLEIDPNAPISLKGVNYTIRVKGDGTKEDFEEIHETVIKTSPNRATIANSINIVPSLVVED